MTAGMETTEAAVRPCGCDALAASRLLWQVYAASGLLIRALTALRPLIARFDRLVAVIPNQPNVLEIGCGTGLLLFLLHRQGLLREGVGLDIDAAAIAAAQRAAQARKLPIEFHRSITLRDWPVEQFDLVLMVDVLHHVPRASRRQMIEAALARVTAGGLFIYKDMCRRPVFRRLWNQLHDLILARQLVSVEPIEHVLGWAAAAGFVSMTSERYVGAGLYGHELEVLRRRVA
jgi:2-polyprenyl-3-methyl-5-hydroxy-6-metoxy-1,4-benzoquinol methylase